MNRIGYPGFSFLLIAALAMPGLARQAGQASDDAYRTFYNEKDPAKKADLGQKFLTDFKESQYRPGVYQTILNIYVQGQNWAKVVETADKLTDTIPNADAKLKELANQYGMAAAQAQNNTDKTLQFADKVLLVNANNLNAQIVIATTLPERMPQDKAANDKAFDLGNKALAGVKQYFSQPKPANMTDAQWKQEQANYEAPLHSAIGLVYLNRNDYPKAIEEYETVLKITPKDGVAHFRIGLAYSTQASEATKGVLEAYKAENDAKTARADQAQIDELAAKRQALETDLRDKRDKAIDELAMAVAIGGVVGQPARQQLERLYKLKNNDSLEGLDQLIQQKKSQLGAQ